MHELSIALSIVEGVTAEFQERELEGRVSAIHLQIGELSGVVKDALLFAYDAACEDTPLAGSRLYITEVPAVISCVQCGCERAPVSARQLECSVCGTSAAGLAHGTELLVTGLEVSDEQHAAAG